MKASCLVRNFAISALIGSLIGVALPRGFFPKALSAEKEKAERPIPYRTITGHKGAITKAVFSPDGKQLLTAAFDGSKIKMWDVASGKLLHELENSGDTEILIYSPNGRLIAARGFNGDKAGGPIEVWIWDATTGKLLATFNPRGCEISGFAFSSDSKLLVVGANEDSVKIWDVTAGKLLPDKRGWPYPRGPVDRENAPVFVPHMNYLAFAPDGKQVVRVKLGCGVMTLYDADTGKKSVELTDYTKMDYTENVRFLRFSRDGRHLISTHRDSKVRTWDRRSGRLLSVASLPHIPDKYYGNPSKFSPDGSLIVIEGENRILRLWDLASAKKVWELPARTPYNLYDDHQTAIGFSSDGRWLATATSDCAVEIWDLDNILKRDPSARKKP